MNQPRELIYETETQFSTEIRQKEAAKHMTAKKLSTTTTHLTPKPMHVQMSGFGLNLLVFETVSWE